MEESRRRGRRLAVAGAVAVAAAAGAGAWLWLRPKTPPAPPPIGVRAGAAIANGAVAAIAVAEEIREPYRCAGWGEEEAGDDRDAGVPAEPEVVTAYGRQLERAGHTLRVSGGNRELVIGFVADARGASPHTLAHIAAVRAAFEARGVELVISLGGMGRDEAEITSVLDALARDARWPVIAVPGGRESLPAHRAAVDAVADSGRAVVYDGASVRIIEMDGVAIGTIPGIAEPGQLMAGNDGCVHEVESLVVSVNELARLPTPRVLASYAPPRQRGEGGSDVGAGGVHIGEPALALAVAAADPVAVVHGLVDEAAAGDTSGKPRHPRAKPALIGAGAIEGLPLWTDDGRVLGASAVVVDVAKSGLTWRRIALPVAVD